MKAFWGILVLVIAAFVYLYYQNRNPTQPQSFTGSSNIVHGPMIIGHSNNAPDIRINGSNVNGTIVGQVIGNGNNVGNSTTSIILNSYSNTAVVQNGINKQYYMVSRITNLSDNASSGTFIVNLVQSPEPITINNYFTNSNPVSDITNNPTGRVNVDANGDWGRFTAAMMLMEHFKETRDYSNAFNYAYGAIQIIEKSNSSVVLDAPIKAHIYFDAAFTLDMIEGNPQLAFDLARKSLRYDNNKIVQSLVAITSANLANELIKNGDYDKALELNQIATSSYETNRAFFLTVMDRSTVGQWYNRSAWLLAMQNKYKEAEAYSYRAVDLNPSKENAGLLGSIIQKQGYRVIWGGYLSKATESNLLIFMRETNNQNSEVRVLYAPQGSQSQE